MVSILIFLVTLSVLVLVHELGHFISARRHGIKVEEFGFGYPPKIFGFKKGETVYSLNLLPFGGFVRMLGEDEARGDRSFFVKGKLVRTIVLLAGVSMNFLLGVFLFAAIYTKLGIPEPVDYLVVTNVVSGSPAQAAGIIVNDKIIGFSQTNDFIDYVSANRGELITLALADREVALTPRLAEATPEGEGALGVAISNIDYVQYPFWERPVRGVWLGLKEAIGWGKEILTALGQMMYRLIQGNIPKDVAGPVGIYEISKQASQQGFLASLQFAGILSINLAILNLLPLPALDGGRLFFILIELLTRKRVKARVEQAIHLAGMAFLIGLMILITVADVRRLMVN